MIKQFIIPIFLICASCSTLKDEVVDCPKLTSPKKAAEIVVNSKNNLSVYIGLRGVELYCVKHDNYIDMTALALPTAYSKNGLPTSMQIVAPAGQENFVIQLGTALEKALVLGGQPNLSPLYFN